MLLLVIWAVTRITMFLLTYAESAKSTANSPKLILRMECVLMYCNRHADLINALCGGSKCSRVHLERCHNHWVQHGIYDPGRVFNPDECHSRGKGPCPTNPLDLRPNNYVIWTYWDSPKVPPEVLSIVYSWQLHSPEYQVRLLNRNTIKCYLDDDYPDVTVVTLRADLVRLKLLYLYGGVWIDSTVVLLEPLGEILNWRDLVQQQHFYGITDPSYSNDPHDFLESWFLAASAGSPVLGRWSELLERVTRQNGGVTEGMSLTTNIFTGKAITAYDKIAKRMDRWSAKRWSEYFSLNVAYTWLYHHSDEFRRLALESSLDMTHRVGYSLQLAYNWNMSRFNDALLTPKGQHVVHQAPGKYWNTAGGGITQL